MGPGCCAALMPVLLYDIGALGEAAILSTY
jgi:hypothetical protein